MKRALMLSVVLSACATGAPLSQTRARQDQAQLRLVDASTDMPARRVRLELPTTREMAHSSRKLVSRVELCVTPAGDTETVKIRGSSGDKLFDEAVVADVTRLQYRPRAGGDVTCEQAIVTYTP